MKLKTIAGVCTLVAALGTGLYPAISAPLDILTYTGPDRDKQVLEGARKEGQVTIYSTVIVNQALRPLADAFSKKYPFMKVNYWRGDIGDLLSKVTAEIRADNLVVDVIEGTLGEIAVGAGIVQPFKSPQIAGFPEAYRDPQNNWAPTRFSYFGVAYNTKLVPPGQQPKTYDDLLDPRWTGKMAWRIDDCCGNMLFITSLRKAWGEDRAMAYFEKLAKQKLVNFASGSARTLVDRVIAGEYPLAINIFAHHPLISAGKGASVATQLLEPVPATASQVMVVKGVRRPHAAMLLVDFLLGEEGQAILSKAEYFPARTGVPSLPSIAGAVPSNSGKEVNFVSPADVVTYTPKSAEIYNTKFR
jgi:iron(III) transport system substrate-binding protein